MKKLFYNGKIITMEEECPEERTAPEAVLVEDGIIAAAGTFDELKGQTDSDTVMQDLRGRCLMPSFIDTHSHFVMDARFSQFADLSSAASFSDITDILKAHMQENAAAPDDVLIGFGYDDNFLEEHAHPDKLVLDTVSTQIPIVIVHVSSHLACANSRALELAGITGDTPDPAGGLIGRIEGSREPDGYLEESGLAMMKDKVMDRVKSDDDDIMRNIGVNYIKHGITTVQDGATTKGDFDLLAKMARAGRLKTDVVAYPLMTAGGVALMHSNKEYCRNYIGNLKIGGYKLVLDGSLQGKTGWITEAYEDGEEGYCGYAWMKDEDLEDCIRTVIKEKQQLLTHCNGDAAGDQLLDAYEKIIRETGCRDELRPVMIHCQTVRNDQLDRMAALDMIASIFTGHVYYWGDVHMKNLGEKRTMHISPVKDALKRGISVNFHQDTPVTAPDMLHSVWCAVNRISRKGVKIGEDQCINVYDALKAVTKDAAFEYFEEDSKGTITPGKRADLVILSDSPLEVGSMQIREIEVLETIKDGETIYRK